MISYTIRKVEKLFQIHLRYIEIFYISWELRGLRLEIEFPSDWHEERMGWIRWSLGFISGGMAFPWKWVVPDEFQCSGPTYGFYFHYDVLVFSWGKARGKNSDPHKTFNMPWHWKFVEHLILSEKETHEYRYILKSGEVQDRTATINVESREWKRSLWWPRRLYRKSIDVGFSDEVGERSGSWKGGTLGCGYDLKDGETPLVCLRRMEMERKF